MQESDVARLLKYLAGQARIRSIAREFNISVREMAVAALDAGIAFVRARILTPDAGEFFSPAPIADEGWDAMSDNPAERSFYVRFCRRLCALAGVVPIVLEHYRFSTTERLVARNVGAVASVIAAMDRLGLPYIPAYWPTSDGECGGTATPACGFRLLVGSVTS
jgi:hypothetical protein